MGSTVFSRTLIGACFVLYIGWVAWRSEVHEDDAMKLAHGPVRRRLNRVSAVIIRLSAIYWVYNLTRIT